MTENQKKKSKKEETVIKNTQLTDIEFDVEELFPEYDVGDLLSQGGYGNIYYAERKSDSKKCVIKLFFPHVNQIYVKREILFTFLLSNYPQFSTIIEARFLDSYMIMVLEYHKSESCTFTRIRSFNEKLKYILELAKCLETLHNLGITHHDVKPANFLFNPESGKGILIDFGLCTINKSVCLNPKNKQILTDFQLTVLKALNGEDKAKIHSMGTGIYLPPEKRLYQNEHYSNGVDAYAVGCIAFELFTEKYPFQKINNLIQRGFRNHAKLEIFNNLIVHQTLLLIILHGSAKCTKEYKKLEINLTIPHFYKDAKLDWDYLLFTFDEFGGDKELAKSIILNLLEIQPKKRASMKEIRESIQESGTMSNLLSSSTTQENK